MTPIYDPLEAALREDIGSGDLTAQYFIAADRTGRGRIVAREPGVISGVEISAETFRRVDPELVVHVTKHEGERVEPDETVLSVSGRVRSIVTAERVALNFLQRLSGVATLTRHFVDAVRHTKVRILDTRKTTPGLRVLEKAAVRAGGGQNHRFGLYDMVMMKDNHFALQADSASLQTAIDTLAREHPGVRVELEADDLDGVRRCLELNGIQVILLDNMPLEEMAEAVRLGAGRVQFEASGGVTLDRVGAIADTGVDFISAGCLTHSARAIDFSLELEG